MNVERRNSRRAPRRLLPECHTKPFKSLVVSDGCSQLDHVVYVVHIHRLPRGDKPTVELQVCYQHALTHTKLILLVVCMLTPRAPDAHACPRPPTTGSEPIWARPSWVRTWQRHLRWSRDLKQLWAYNKLGMGAQGSSSPSEPCTCSAPRQARGRGTGFPTEAALPISF